MNIINRHTHNYCACAMASPIEQRYGPVDISEETLGSGAYGKVFKAKCGQLPCAAKLLHDTLYQDDDPGSLKLTSRFQQECEFLSDIRHPNIVLYLGTTTDTRSGRLVLLMELMDTNLTRFLEHSQDIPYHSQLNICHDTALALNYLHSNGIIHRDLSSNNVLLIGDGTVSKVTDFGMSKLVNANPRMTPLTQVPGTAAYMPPEALISPPQYSMKLDCFSHGVLTIQILTKNFPDPGDAMATRDTNNLDIPSGHVLVPIPETERRQKDIALIESDHPLKSIALLCISDRERERLSAVGLCERLALLKREEKYLVSKEQTRDQVYRLHREIERKDREMEEKDIINKKFLDNFQEAQRETAEKEEEIEYLQEKVKSMELKIIKHERREQVRQSEVYNRAKEFISAYMELLDA